MFPNEHLDRKKDERGASSRYDGHDREYRRRRRHEQDERGLRRRERRERSHSPQRKRSYEGQESYKRNAEQEFSRKNDYFRSRFTGATDQDTSQRNDSRLGNLEGMDFGVYGTRMSKEPAYEEPKQTPGRFIKATQSDRPSGDTTREVIDEQPAKSQRLEYIIGDNGSRWRMMKLRRVFDMAKDSHRPVEDVALERYGSLEEFDDALEEKEELDHRKATGKIKKDAPTGEKYRNRLENERKSNPLPPESSSSFSKPTQDDLNKVKAQVLRAQAKNSSDYEALKQQYDTMYKRFEDTTDGNDQSRLEPFLNKGDPSIEEMVQEEKLLNKLDKHGLNKDYAKRITRDSRFSNDFDYLDENANRLADRMNRREIDMNHVFQGGNLSKMNRVLDSCPLCMSINSQPLAPVIALSHRVYLSLPTKPELAKYHCLIVPTNHRVNMLSCDEDEWDEVRNFMKCIALMFDSMGMGVIFYENAPSPQRFLHTAIECVPVPKRTLSLAPAYFREAILTSDDEWSQHRKIIDTMKGAEKYGKLAFRKMMVKELGYFHVWFTVDGGFGHVVENEKIWGQHDQVPRQVFASMLNLPPEVIRRRGKWTGIRDPAEDAFRARFRPFDWTQSLLE
ncbi:complexed with Cdc5 protein Cwf19 [Schizosaccharomyces cryophilus OY26]|uniref:Complexed with Cdc5 protein Cwf19 n=1 Tax=Schizosaccharomyces cryophilus (strain OY26 / ATCC MYA-4695 / CBS 11777 / NBRC 106824 / NRRL Y48691) TaxID=653667 RepID=S9XAS8_SCHCR|nr:complexed with Cdc5 protein Cwf19 [Schizosaccharomyces cryophilus OY26]EPY50831.1 complexed with Cdc5 protein Cwf19 [Schizosaccharomyces cryophilus OY26]